MNKRDHCLQSTNPPLNKISMAIRQSMRKMNVFLLKDQSTAKVTNNHHVTYIVVVTLVCSRETCRR